MPAYWIGYKLEAKGQNYDGLYSAIKDIGGWWRHTTSSWIVTSNSKATDIRDTLKEHIDENDTLIVAKLSGEAAWANIGKNGSEWLKSNL